MPSIRDEIASDTQLIDKIKRKLPKLFHIAELESSRAGKIGMEVGSLRERIIVAMLVYKFGGADVESELPITEPEVDARVRGNSISIKTLTSRRFAGVKLVWTVDAQNSIEFKESYIPTCDMIFIQISWRNTGGFYYIPLAAQIEILETIGKNGYIKLPPQGTNPRGVEITAEALGSLICHTGTLKIDIHWSREAVTYNPYNRWVSLARDLKRKKKGTSTSSFGASARIGHDSSKFYNTKLYEGLPISEGDGQVDNDLPPELENKVILGSSESMNDIPDCSIQLMITSPPYNVTKEYDGNLSLQQYLDLLRNVFTETHRVLVNGGRACVNIANVGRRPYIPLSDSISMMMNEIGFNMRGEIIWNKGSSAGVSMAWGSFKSASNPVLRDVHEYIMVFSKGEYGRPSEGKESTITNEQFMEWTKSIWNFSTISAKRVGHPAPFPFELPYRLIQLYSFKNDVILDPFMGSGTTGLAAMKAGRRYVGFEIDREYHKKGEDRLSAYKNQEVLDFDLSSDKPDQLKKPPRRKISV